VLLREARTSTGAEAETIRSLLKPYLSELHSLTRTDESVPSADYPYLPLYWSEAGRSAFIFAEGDNVVGFALIRGPESTETGTWEMSEFYICPSARDRGVGQAAAVEVWRRFPGAWEVEVSRANRRAVSFWSRAIHRATGEPPGKPVPAQQDVGRLVFRFTVPKPPN